MEFNAHSLTLFLHVRMWLKKIKKINKIKNKINNKINKINKQKNKNIEKKLDISNQLSTKDLNIKIIQKSKILSFLLRIE